MHTKDLKRKLISRNSLPSLLSLKNQHQTSDTYPFTTPYTIKEPSTWEEFTKTQTQFQSRASTASDNLQRSRLKDYFKKNPHKIKSAVPTYMMSYYGSIKFDNPPEPYSQIVHNVAKVPRKKPQVPKASCQKYCVAAKTKISRPRTICLVKYSKERVKKDKKEVELVRNNEPLLEYSAKRAWKTFDFDQGAFDYYKSILKQSVVKLKRGLL